MVGSPETRRVGSRVSAMYEYGNGNLGLIDTSLGWPFCSCSPTLREPQVRLLRISQTTRCQKSTEYIQTTTVCTLHVVGMRFSLCSTLLVWEGAPREYTVREKD